MTQFMTPQALADEIPTVGGSAAPPPMPPARPAPDRQNQTPPVPATGDVDGWRSWLQSYVPDDLKDDPEFMNTVLAGAHAESKLDPSIDQPDGNGHGLFQFDNTPGGDGRGVGLTDAQLHDPAYQASIIVPAYADTWRNAPRGMSPAAKASWVAGYTERPYQYTDPNSQQRRNYAASHAVVSGPPSPAQAGNATGKGG
jgi:hypothetical protein